MIWTLNYPDHSAQSQQVGIEVWLHCSVRAEIEHKFNSNTFADKFINKFVAI